MFYKPIFIASNTFQTNKVRPKPYTLFTQTLQKISSSISIPLKISWVRNSHSNYVKLSDNYYKDFTGQYGHSFDFASNVQTWSNFQSILVINACEVKPSSG